MRRFLHRIFDFGDLLIEKGIEMRTSLEINKTSYFLTQHAKQRAQQRGIKCEVIAFILRYADTVLEAGAQCQSYRVSASEATLLKTLGQPAHLIERCKNVIILVSTIDTSIVTVLKDRGSKSGRCYRKQMPTKSKKASQQLNNDCDYLNNAVLEFSM